MRPRTVLATGAASATTAVAGAFAVDPSSAWYRSLRKPSWQPPPAAFPLVWTPLYIDIAVAGAVAIDRLEAGGDAPAARAYRSALGVNLALNATWSWLFFRSRRPVLAAVECAVLTASSVDLVRRSSGGPGRALVPYAAWCGFATVLSAAIAWLNPRVG